MNTPHGGATVLFTIMTSTTLERIHVRSQSTHTILLFYYQGGLFLENILHLQFIFVHRWHGFYIGVRT